MFCVLTCHSPLVCWCLLNKFNTANILGWEMPSLGWKVPPFSEVEVQNLVKTSTILAGWQC